MDVIGALAKFMRSKDWQESVETFIIANCDRFRDVGTFSHDQYGIWRNFQDIVESILACAMEDVAGGTLEDLEQALDRLSREPASGPREANKKELLAQLLTYESFEAFSDMMHTASQLYSSYESYESPQHPAAAPTNSSPSAMYAATPSDDENHYEYSYLDGTARDGPGEYPFALPEAKATWSDCKDVGANDEEEGYIDFLEEDARERDEIEQACLGVLAMETLQQPGELRAKFLVALSILDSANSNNLTESVLQQLNWASSMCTLFQEMVSCYHNKIPFEQGKVNHAGGLIVWFEELDKQFNAFREQTSCSSARGADDVARLRALEEIAAMGTDDERYMHSLIQRHEEVMKQLAGLHGKCVLLTSHGTQGPTIKREHLEELYLYLKEHVNSGMDLTHVSDEMYNLISQLIPSEESTEVVNLLLDIHVLEDEQILLRRKIASLLNDPNAFGDADSKGHSDSSSSLSNSLLAAINRQEKDADRKGDEKLSPIQIRREISNFSSLVPDVSPSKEEYRGIKAEIQDKQDKDSGHKVRLDALREQHREGLKRLQENLQAQKAKVMAAVEKRIAMRKRNNLAMATDEAETEENPLAVFDLDSFAHLEEALVQGYKRRCVYETKALSDAKLPDLSPELLADARRDAADDIRRRYELETNRLMEELRNRRLRDRERTRELLEARRNKDGASRGMSSTALKQEEARVLEEFDKEFDKTEKEAILAIQRQACAALAAIVGVTSGSSVTTPIDRLISAARTSGAAVSPLNRRSGGVHDEDSYFASPGKTCAEDPAEMERLLKEIKVFADSYSAVGASLMSKAEQEVRNNRSLAVETVESLPSAIFDIVLTSCENHLMSRNDYPFGHPSKGLDDLESIKARVLDEYEKSKLKANFAEQAEHDQRSNRLAKRLEQRKSKFSDVVLNESEEGRVESIMELAVSGMLGETPESLIQIAAPTSSVAPASEGNESNASKVFRSLDDVSKKDVMLSQERGYQKDLVDNLQAQMAMRKGILEDRLRSKRRAKELLKLEADSVNVPPIPDADITEDEQKLTQLEQAFEIVKSLVEGSNAADLKNMSIDALLALIEHALRGKDNSAVKDMEAAGGSQKSAPRSLPPILPENKYRDGYEDLLKDIERILQSNQLKGGSQGSDTGSSVPSSSALMSMAVDMDYLDAEEERRRHKQRTDEMMQTRAKGLSEEYSQEKEKLDLRMKIEQARQQQTLQRKLLERRQSKVSSMSGAGFSSDGAAGGGGLLAGMMAHGPKSNASALVGLHAQNRSVLPTGGAGYSSSTDAAKELADAIHHRGRQLPSSNSQSTSQSGSPDAYKSRGLSLKNLGRK